MHKESLLEFFYHERTNLFLQFFFFFYFFFYLFFPFINEWLAKRHCQNTGKKNLLSTTHTRQSILVSSIGGEKGGRRRGVGRAYCGQAVL